jgi:hypothetical protein
VAETRDVPALLLAFTVKVYGVPSISGVIAQVKNVVVQVRPLGSAVTVYDVAPIEGNQATVAAASPETTLTPVGANGATAAKIGITGLLATESAEVPAEFDALTEKVYAVPLLSGAMEQVKEAVAQDNPPGLEVTV